MSERRILGPICAATESNNKIVQSLRNSSTCNVLKLNDRNRKKSPEKPVTSERSILKDNELTGSVGRVVPSIFRALQFIRFDVGQKIGWLVHVLETHLLNVLPRSIYSFTYNPESIEFHVFVKRSDFVSPPSLGRLLEEIRKGRFIIWPHLRRDSIQLISLV